MSLPKHQVHNLIILDESGSMESIKRPTIQAFNEIIQTTKGLEKKFQTQEHRISLVSFNGLSRKTHLWNQPVKTIRPINEQNYRPDANTPLYDAIGYAASRLQTELIDVARYNVLVTILTDGEENASQEWNREQVKKLVEQLKAKRWTFTYLGTDHDVAKAATNISITNTVSFGRGELFSLPVQEAKARERYSQKIQDEQDTAEDFYKA